MLPVARSCGPALCFAAKQLLLCPGSCSLTISSQTHHLFKLNNFLSDYLYSGHYFYDQFLHYAVFLALTGGIYVTMWHYSVTVLLVCHLTLRQQSLWLSNIKDAKPLENAKRMCSQGTFGLNQVNENNVAAVALHVILDTANSLPYPRNRSPPYLYPVSCQLSDKELSVLTSMKY